GDVSGPASPSRSRPSLRVRASRTSRLTVNDTAAKGGGSSLSWPTPWKPSLPTAGATGRQKPPASPRKPPGAGPRPGGLLPAQDAVVGLLGAFTGMRLIVSSPLSPPRSTSTAVEKEPGLSLIGTAADHW